MPRKQLQLKAYKAQGYSKLENAMSQKPIHRVFTLVSMAMFAGSLLLSMAQLYSSAFEQQPTEDAATAAKSNQTQLKAYEQGYERVLQREPENQVALRGLVDTRLQMKDAKGAKEPLEKLVKLNPQQQEYKFMLARVKQQMDK